MELRIENGTLLWTSYELEENIVVPDGVRKIGAVVSSQYHSHCPRPRAGRVADVADVPANASSHGPCHGGGLRALRCHLRDRLHGSA